MCEVLLNVNDFGSVPDVCVYRMLYQNDSWHEARNKVIVPMKTEWHCQT